MRPALLLAACLLYCGTPARGGDAIEAVTGTITAPMQKKTVLESPGPTNQENHGTKGGATYGFTCPSSATVEVHAVALVLGTMQDSHFVSVDGGAKVIWEMLVNNKVMHDWENTAKTPSFAVSAGDHLFEIAEKEDGARFYELHISGGCTWLASRAAAVPAADFTSVLAPWRVLPLVEFKGATDSFDSCPPGDTACSGELSIPFTCTGDSTATFKLNSLRWNVALYASIAVDGAGWQSWDLHDSIFWDLSAASPSFSVTAGSHTVSLGGDSPGVKLIQVAITSGSCAFADPPTDVPATSVPMTPPPTPAPPTNVPETNVPDTDAPPTNVPETSIPETDVPETDAPPTDVPTPAPPTDIPDTDAPPTDAPPTDVPTPAPPTDVPETDVPETDAPPTNVPDTDVPPTDVPDTNVPETNVPPTDVPETDVPKTNVPMTNVPPTDVPDTTVPETAVPDTDTPPTDVPQTSAPATAVPDTNVPPTAVPATPQPTDAPTATPGTATDSPTDSPTDAPAAGTTPVPGTPGQPCSGLGLTACQAAAQCAWGGSGCGLATACTGLAEAACGGQQACAWKGGASGCVARGGECLGLDRGGCRALPQTCVWAADRTCRASPCAGAASGTCATVPGCVLPPGGACASECAGQSAQAGCGALPACVWTDRGTCAPAECALATTDQACGSLAACAWKNGQCAATACTGLASDACDAAPGCVVRGGSCAATACGGVAPQAACEAKAGCEWASGAVCAATECSLLPAGPCQALASCAWSAGVGACDTSPCRGADTSAVCETRAGCVWANDECAASATPAPGAACAGNAQAACDADAACVWAGGACAAAGSECPGLTEAGCAAAAACAWVGGACAAVPCAGVAKAVCDAAVACVWSAATGSCETECAAAATQGACGTLAACAWASAGAGACQATACTGAGQVECTTRGACAWNGAQCAVLSCDGRTQVECTSLGAACQWDGAACAAAEVVYTLQPSGPGEVTGGGSQGRQTLAPTNVGGAAQVESLYAGGSGWLSALSKVAAASHFVPYNVAGPLLSGQAQLLALECWVDDDLPFFVHPTRFNIGDTKHTPYLSCLAGNLILLLCAAVLHFIAAVVMKQVKGDAKKGQGAVMFPGLLMFFYMALVPGSVLAGAHLMFNGPWWPAGLFAELFVIGVAAAIFFRLRDIPARAAFCEDTKKRHAVARFFLGPGEWRSVQPHAVATYGPVFMWYNDRYPRFFVAELLFTFIVCFAQGVRSHSDADQCSSKLVVQGISFIVFALLIVALRPFARPFCNWFIVAAFTFISAGLITTAIQLKANGRSTAVREVLLSIGLIILLLQGLISLGILVYVKMSRRAAHCPLLSGNNNTTRGAEKYRDEMAESILNTPATTSSGTPGDPGLDASGSLLDSSGDQVNGGSERRSRRGSNYSQNSFTPLPQPPPARPRGGVGGGSAMATKGYTGVAPGGGGAGRGSAKGSPMLENPLSGFGQSPSPPRMSADTGAMSGSGGASGAADLASWVRRARGRSTFGAGAGGAMTLPPAPRRGSGIVSRESSHSRIGV